MSFKHWAIRGLIIYLSAAAFYGAEKAVQLLLHRQEQNPLWWLFLVPAQGLMGALVAALAAFAAFAVFAGLIALIDPSVLDKSDDKP